MVSRGRHSLKWRMSQIIDWDSLVFKAKTKPIAEKAHCKTWRQWDVIVFELVSHRLTVRIRRPLDAGITIDSLSLRLRHSQQ